MAEDVEGAGSEEFTVVDDAPDDADAGSEAAAVPETRTINANRVRQLSALRRGAYRTRSYCVIAAVVCGVAILQLAVLTVRHVRLAGWGVRPAGYVCGALAAAMAAAYFYRRAAELTQELRQRPAALAEPPVPPDFSTLSDGSQSWKNLEQMRDG